MQAVSTFTVPVANGPDAGREQDGLPGRHLPERKIAADRDGWHTYPSAQLALHCYLMSRDAPGLDRPMAAGLLALLEARRDTSR